LNAFNATSLSIFIASLSYGFLLMVLP